MQDIPTLKAYRLLLDAFTEIPESQRHKNLEPFSSLFETGGGYEIFLEGSGEPIACEVRGVKWHGHADDFTAFSLELSVRNEIVFVEIGELLRPIRRTLPDRSVYYGTRIRLADPKELAA